jgi:hypothetical protein
MLPVDHHAADKEYSEIDASGKFALNNYRAQTNEQ